MNRYSRAIIFEFTSAENRDILFDVLNSHFNNYSVTKYLQENLSEDIMRFSHTIQSELQMSDPLPGIGIHDHVECFNNQFIDDRIDFIESYFSEEKATSFDISDGFSTARYNPNLAPDDMLQSWMRNPSRSVQLREDPSGDNGAYKVNPFYEMGHTTGITFCDQSRIGLQRHIDQFETGSMKAMNKCRPHEETPFGVSTPAADARLLSRRIFRSNEAGVENGILRREARLYNRYLERDISEGLRGAEKGCMVVGYDMSDLRRRIDYKRRDRC